MDRPQLKEIRVEDSVGSVLCHDVTKIIRGVRKGPAFRKGHVVREEDIPVLRSMGKDHLYVWENDDTMLHENDAAQILRRISQGEGLCATEPSEGKIDLIADRDGLLTVNTNRLNAVNALGQMMIASRHGGFIVKKGDKIAGMRIIPLVIGKEEMQKAVDVAGPEPLFQVVPLRKKRCGIIVTGNEVHAGRIEDTFTDVIRDKLSELGAEAAACVTAPDDPSVITEKINELFEQSMDMVICTGGMSVDPDDRTPLAIKDTGAQIVSYGSPVLPGAMFLLAYKDGRPLLGLPGCVMYSKRTVFDLVLPSLLADVPVTKERLAQYGEGGLCLSCDDCTFPNCFFGK